MKIITVVIVSQLNSFSTFFSNSMSKSKKVPLTEHHENQDHAYRILYFFRESVCNLFLFSRWACYDGIPYTRVWLVYQRTADDSTARS